MDLRSWAGRCPHGEEYNTSKDGLIDLHILTALTIFYLKRWYRFMYPTYRCETTSESQEMIRCCSLKKNAMGPCCWVVGNAFFSFGEPVLFSGPKVFNIHFPWMQDDFHVSQGWLNHQPNFMFLFQERLWSGKPGSFMKFRYQTGRACFASRLSGEW